MLIHIVLVHYFCSLIGKSVRFNLWIVNKGANKDLEQYGTTTMMDLFFNIEISYLPIYSMLRNSHFRLMGGQP